MKKRKIVVLCVAFTMSCLIGCTPLLNRPEHIATSEQPHQSSDVTEAETENSGIQTYEPQSQSYSISISEIKGGWTVYPNPGNEEQLVLDNEDMSFSILMQSFPKQSNAYQDFASFESFYRDTTAASMGEGKVENIAIENDAIINSSTIVYAVESQGHTFYGQITVFETANAYYSGTITGIDEIYNINIKEYEMLYNSFEEK